MQPPPRKVKHASALKLIHTEQLQKLQSKHQQEVELLEDIRIFSQKRSAIEKEYAQSLLKLTSSLLKKDIVLPPDISSEDGKEHKQSIGRTAVIVWRQILEELEKVAKARLAASEIYYEKCAEPAKPLKNAKVQCLKKLVSQLSLIQSEVAQSVLEMTKAHKIYIADETQTNDAKQKAVEADEKLKRKSVGFFKSMTSLQRNCSKLTTRYEQCATKSTSSRNEYLLCQSAANAHQIRYYSVDLPELMKALDGEVYERIQDYFTIHTSTSAEVSAIETNCFQKLSHEAEKISRNYNLQCFLHESNVFTDLLQYQFEPCCNDQVTKLSQDYGASHQLEKEARKWATKISKETKAIREHLKNLKAVQTQLKSDVAGGAGTEKSDSVGPDSECQLEELKQNIRRAETAKMKAEARIELLGNIGINVDEWLTQIDSLAAEPDAVSRTPSQASVRTESSSGPTEEPEATYTHFDDDDDYVEEVAEIEQVSMSPAIQSSSSSRQYPIYAQALYTFQATNPDELGLEENESIEVIGDGDGDGWVQAKDSQGQVGFIPESYVRFLEDGEQPSMQPTTTASMETYDPSSSLDMPSMSSPPHAALSTPDLPPAPDIPPATDLTAEEIRAAGQDNNDMPPPPDFTMTNHMEPPSDVSHYDVASSFSSGDLEVQQATAQTTSEIPAVPNLPLIPNDGEIWARALYDYEGNTDDELSFTEGTYIRIIRIDENGIDDGFWRGEIEGEIGVFPSLLVEELIENGEQEQDLLTPVKGGPPDFAPPPPVMVTLPTPDRLTPPSLSNGQAKTNDSTSTTTTTTTTTTSSTGEQVSEPKESEKPPASEIEGSSDSAAASEETKDVNAVAETEIVDAESSESKTTDSSKPEESTKQTSGSLDQVESAVESDLSDQQPHLDSKPGSLDQSQDKVESIDETESLEKTESSSKTKSANGSESSEQATSLKDSSSLDKSGLCEETSTDSKKDGEDSQTFKSSDEFGQPIENNVPNAVTDDVSMDMHDDNIVATLPAESTEPSVESKKEEVEGEKEKGREMEKEAEHEEEERPKEGAEMIKKPADDGEQDIKKEETKAENVEDNTEMDVLL